MTPIDPRIPEGPDNLRASRSPTGNPAKDVDPPREDATLDLESPRPTTSPELPARAGRYPILRELGRGGMGIVFLAEDPTLGRRVAIKRLPDSLAADPGRLERFRQEARLLASLNHPNIATVYSLEETGETCFLTMEAIDGETLGSRLTGAPMTVRESLRVGRQIARALEAAHKRGIVHRDLKPGNIMFTSDLDVKVLDFGLAASTASASSGGSSGGSTGGTGDSRAGDGSGGTGARSGEHGRGEPGSGRRRGSGTPGYMSPEQVAGAASDPRMDVWSFGCVLFECLTGEPVVGGQTAVERMLKTSVARLDLHPLPDSTPLRLRGLLERCLARDVGDRYPSMTEPRQVIEELLAELSFQSVYATSDGDRTAAPNNLPRHGSLFIGRASEIAEVAARLARYRLVTLTGIGGGGKTRLAIRVAETFLGESLDGLWFVELAPLSDPDDIAGAILRAIGIPESLDRPTLETITRHLSSKKALLVLDNCEHLIEGAAEVVNTLLRDVPGLRILVTSRERLAVDGEASYAVPLLDVPDLSRPLDLETVARSTAVELFLQRARQVGQPIELNASNASTVAEICRRLDGIPLAIELAAARLKVLGVDGVLRRMDDRFRLLTGGSRGDLPHHRTLRALIDWSYEQLDPVEQVLFRRLSVFAGGWTLEAAEAVAVGGVVPDWDVLDLSSRLADKSLVVADVDASEGITRFRMLETVRAYAAERLEESGEAGEIRGRHRDYYVALAQRAEPEFTGGEQALWFSRIGAEHDEIRRAFESCRIPEADPSLGLRMAGSLFRYWIVRGHWTEADAQSREALLRADPLVPTVEAARVLNCVATVAYHRGNLDEARLYWQKSLAVWTALDKPSGIGAARHNLGNVAFSAGDYPSAAVAYAESLESYRRLDLPDGVGRALISMANVSLCQGHFEESRRFAAEALERLRAVRHAELIAHALITLGTVSLRLDDLGAAARYYEESLEIQKELGDRRNTAIATINLAVVAHMQKQLPKAHRYFIEAASMFLTLGDVPSVASALEGLATLAQVTGDDAGALKTYGAAAAIRENCGIPLMPDEAHAVEEIIRATRLRLGEERASTLFAEGREMSVDAAVGWAVREIRVEEQTP